MGGQRIAEHVRAVANRADDQPIRRRRLQSQGHAQAPAQAARRSDREHRARLAEPHLLQDEGGFLDEDRILALGLVDAVRDPHRRHGPRLARRDQLGLPLSALGGPLGGQAFAARLHPVPGARPRGQGLRQGGQCGAEHASDSQVAIEGSHGILGEQGVRAQVDDPGVGPRPFFAGQPRHVAVDNHDQIRALKQGVGIEAEMHRMIPGQGHIARFALADGKGEGLGQVAELGDIRLVTAKARGNDQRVFRPRDHIRRLVYGAQVWKRRRCGAAPCGRSVSLLMGRRGQDFARQGQIDRPLRLGAGQVDGPIDRAFQRRSIGELIVPFDEFADERALIAHFLRPMDFA